MASRDFWFYRSLFSEKPNVASLSSIASYSELKNTFPEKFNFKIINNMFSSFLSLWDQKNFSCNVFHEYHKLTWRATVFSEKNFYTNKYIDSIHIKLSNDGFVYSDPSELSALSAQVGPRHQTIGWILLTPSELSKFSAISQFCHKFEWLNGGGGGSAKLQFQVFYNFHHDRIDFKAINKQLNRVVVVTFEPGFPESELEDHWYDEESSSN